jgi:hypothetical protein
MRGGEGMCSPKNLRLTPADLWNVIYRCGAKGRNIAENETCCCVDRLIFLPRKHRAAMNLR